MALVTCRFGRETLTVPPLSCFSKVYTPNTIPPSPVTIWLASQSWRDGKRKKLWSREHHDSSCSAHSSFTVTSQQQLHRIIETNDLNQVTCNDRQERLSSCHPDLFLYSFVITESLRMTKEKEHLSPVNKSSPSWSFHNLLILSLTLEKVSGCIYFVKRTH